MNYKMGVRPKVNLPDFTWTVTFAVVWGFAGMKTFLRVLLILLLALLGLKLLPVIFGLAIGILVFVSLALALGFGAAGILFSLGVILAVLLSPIWIPVLAILGLIALCRRHEGNA